MADLPPEKHHRLAPLAIPAVACLLGSLDDSDANQLEAAVRHLFSAGGDSLLQLAGASRPDAPQPVLLLTLDDGPLLKLARIARDASGGNVNVGVLRTSEHEAPLPDWVDRAWTFPAGKVAGVRRHAAGTFAIMRSQIRLFAGGEAPPSDKLPGTAQDLALTHEAHYWEQTARLGRPWVTETAAAAIYDKSRRPFVPPRRRLDETEAGINLRIRPSGIERLDPSAEETLARQQLSQIASWNGALRAAPSRGNKAASKLTGPDGSPGLPAEAGLLLRWYQQLHNGHTYLRKSYDTARQFLLGLEPDRPAAPKTASPLAFSLRLLLGTFASFGFAGSICFAAYAKLYASSSTYQAQAFWLALFLLVVAIGLLVFFWSGHKEQKRGSEDLAALREVLRVQYFWNRAGICLIAADQFPRSHRRRVGTVRIAAANIALAALPEGCPDPNYGFVRDHWLRQQRARFVGTSGSPSQHGLLPRQTSIASRTRLEQDATHGVASGLFFWAILSGVIHLPLMAAKYPGWNLATLAASAVLACAAGAGIYAIRKKQAITHWFRDHHGWHAIPTLVGFSAAAFGTVCISLVAHNSGDISLLSGYLKTGNYSYWWIASSVVAGLLGGMLHTRSNMLALQEHADHAEAMGRLFAEAERAVDELIAALPENPEAAEEIERYLREIGHNSLAETSRWLLEERAHPLTLPHIT